MKVIMKLEFKRIEMFESSKHLEFQVFKLIFRILILHTEDFFRFLV